MTRVLRNVRNWLLAPGLLSRRRGPEGLCALALLLCGLALVARVWGPSSALSPWLGYVLQFLCLFAIGYAVLKVHRLQLEANRLQVRQTLDAREVERLNSGLERSERRLRELVENLTCGVYRARPDGRIIEVNAALVRMLGCASEEELVGDNLPPHLYRNPKEHDRLLARCLATGRLEGEEVDWTRKDGSLIRVRLSGRVVREPADASPNLEVMVEDITERHRAEQALEHSEERYRLLFERHPLALLVFDAKTLSFLAVNEAALRQYGYSREEFLHITMQDLLLSQDVSVLWEELIHSGNRLSFGGVWRHRRKDGTLVHVEVTKHGLEFGGRPAWLMTAYDVSERKKLEEQLRQLQKMEALGRLAGGIAHDFNNLLAVITGYSELLSDSLQSEDGMHKKVDEIRKATARAVSLTHQLLAFSRKQVLEPRVLDVNGSIADLSELLRRVIGEDIELVMQLDPGVGQVKADPSQLEQVLMNLVVNARDAMPRGGKLTLETANIELDQAYARHHPGTTPGRYVMLAVSDTGIGMDAQTQARLFEPFFTTKGRARGTGLGLATVYGIVQQSGGSIEVSSELRRGSTFRIYLPWVDAAVRPVLATEESHPAGGAETILLVEDAEGVRELARESLERRGYAVLVASSPAEALEILQRHGRPIDLLLTDVVLPGMSGSELAARLLPFHPETKVLYMSGYTDDAVVQHGVLEEHVAFLPKPFTLAGLARKVREVLDLVSSDAGRLAGRPRQRRSGGAIPVT
jgi:PAS domain S-box-containing protein